MRSDHETGNLQTTQKIVYSDWIVCPLVITQANLKTCLKINCWRRLNSANTLQKAVTQKAFEIWI